MGKGLKEFINDNRELIILGLILVFALNFRILLLGLHRLHMDECLYSAYAARMVTNGDIGMNGGLGVDKPPLFFYAIALSFFINGISENSARIPNIIFSLITVVFLFRLMKKMYGGGITPLLASFFAAFSVMFTLFSVTAFQDISMTAFMVMSFYYLKEQKHFLSALFYCFSIICKPMTIFIAPVYIALIIMETGINGFLKVYRDYIKAFLFVFIPVTLWSAFLANPRWGMFTFFVSQQPEAMNVSGNIVPRFLVWMGHSEYLLNNYIFLACAVAGVAFSAAGMAIKKNISALKYDLFILFSVLYIYFIFSFLQFRQFDRYVLILIPFMAAALARAVAMAAALLRKKYLAAVFITLILAVYIAPMRNLDKSGLKMGALFDDSDGFDRAASYIINRSGPETKLIYFGHTISWYGYFYINNIKFFAVNLAYDIDTLNKYAGMDRVNTLVILNEKHRDKDEVDKIKKLYKTVHAAGNYLVLERDVNQ